MQVRELGVLVGNVDNHRAVGFAGAAADLRNRVFKAIGYDDLCARFLAGDFVADRLAPKLDIVLDKEATCASTDIDFEIDLGEDRIVELRQCGSEHRKHGGEG